MSKWLMVCWLLLIGVLFVYSYGFVDLNLTLSANPLLFTFVSSIQHLVYFDRATSVNVYIGIILGLFCAYLLTLRQSKVSWRFLALLAIVLALAYPMLSSDVFKYLFAGKEIVLYHANPYVVTPNAFPDDTWIRFMRWVHTTTPYGPVFTLIAVPYYVLGFGKFVPILYLFKCTQVAWYLLSVWLLGKLGNKRAQLFFAYNPLILMEWLVNAHNDAIMITLLLLSVYLYVVQKRAWSCFAILLSIGVKYVTAIFLPFILFPKKIPLNYILYPLFFVLLLAPLLYHYSWQYQPWYVTWIIPFAALIKSRTLKVATAVYSFSVFSRYLYFVSTGSWLGTPTQHALMTFAPPILTALCFFIIHIVRHYRDSNHSSI